jgi:hypothetical protein
MLFCGGSDGRVIVRQAWDLKEVMTIAHLEDHGAVTSMLLHAGERDPTTHCPLSLISFADEYFLIVGTEDGMLHVCTDPDSRWKPMTSSLLMMNPLFS